MDHHYPTMNPPFPKPLHYALPQTPPSLPALVHIKRIHWNPPPPDGEPPPVSRPSLSPLLGAFKCPPPPERKKGVMENTQPPRPPENNCNYLHLTFVVDSIVSANPNLIMQNTLEVFWLFVV